MTRKQATYARRATAAVAGDPSSGSYATHPPQGFILTGPAKFS